MAQYREFVDRLDNTTTSIPDANRGSFSRHLERDCDYRDVDKIRESSLWIITKRTHKRTKAMVVFKQLCGKGSIDMERDLLREIEFLAAFSHPAIIQLKGCLVMTRQSIRPAIVLDYMESGNLEDFMKTPQWDDTTRMITLIGVASALAYAHKHRVILRDLKPAHILFDREGHPKLTGLDKARLVDLENVLINAQKSSGPRESYQAPEMLLPYPLANPDRCDVYSFGRIAIDVLGGTFSADGEVTLDSGNAGLDSLARSCLGNPPQERPSSSQLAYRLSQSSCFIPGADLDKVQKYIELLPQLAPPLQVPRQIPSRSNSGPERPGSLPRTPQMRADLSATPNVRSHRANTDRLVPIWMPTIGYRLVHAEAHPPPCRLDPL
jgi:serine/threonine protein kinase